MKGSHLRRIAVPVPLGGALLLAALAGPAFAAGTPGTISGTVKAPSGSSASGAIVTAADANYHLFRTDAADDGSYTLDSVDPGTYTLTVEAKGLEIAPVSNVVLAAGQKLKQDFAMTVAQPFCFVKAPSPIPLTDDINSTSFADAPDIHVDTAANLNEPVNDLPVLNMWGGPNTAGARFRMKYSSAGIHMAADLTYKNPGVNFGADANIYQGNAIEFDFQNDPYDPTRSTFDNDHDWQLIIALGPTPQWWIYGDLNAAPAIDGQTVPVGNYVMVRNGPKTGEQLVRVDIPWGIFLTSDMQTPIAPPKDGDLGAAELAVDESDPAATADSPAVLYQLTWSGFDTGYQEPAVMKPIQFCPQAP